MENKIFLQDQKDLQEDVWDFLIYKEKAKMVSKEMSDFLGDLK